MEHVLADLFDHLEPRTSITFPYEGYENALQMQMRFAWRYYRSWDFELWMHGQNRNLEDRLHHEQNIVEEQAKEIAQLHGEISALEKNLRRAHEEMTRKENQLRQVYASHSYRLGNALVAPFSILKRHGR